MLFNDIVDIFIFILKIICYVQIDGHILLLLLVDGRREILCPKQRHLRDPLQNLLLSPAMLRVGVTSLLLNVTNESNDVPETQPTTANGCPWTA